MTKYITNFFKSALFRYALVGTAGTFVDLATLYACVEFLKLPILFSSAIAFIAAVLFNFIGNKSFTFKIKSGPTRKFFIKFMLVSILGLGLTLISMKFLIGINIPYLLAKIITSGLVVVWNFLMNKHWTFKIKKRYQRTKENFEFDVSILIPAYNEEKRLKKNLENFVQTLKNSDFSWELIVTDDGSTDTTQSIAEQTLKNIKNIKNTKVIRSPKNHGKGHAVRMGMEHAHGKYILFADADGATSPTFISPMLKKAQQEDLSIVIGSRYLQESHIATPQSKFRYQISRAGNWLIQQMLTEGISDTQCGFKLFEFNAAQTIFSRQKVFRWGFDMEILAIAQNMGIKITEYPVKWHNQAGSQLNPIKDAIKTLWELFYIKINLLSGRYE